MSGETEAHVSGWTVDTLKEHIDKRFELADRAVAAALAASEKRLDGMNEFRDTLTDQAATFMPRTEAEQRMNQYIARLGVLENQVTAFIAAATGRSTGISDYAGWLVGLAGVGIAAASLLTR